MSLHPIMAAALAPFAPADSEVRRIASMPGVEAVEFNNPEDFADSLAGDLELAPIVQDEFTQKLQRAGFAPHPRRRSSDRADANDWARSRASTDNAHRNEVNSRSSDNLGMWS